jgi:hypothetical protein
MVTKIFITDTTKYSFIMVDDWIGKAKVKPGALHRQLGVDQTKPIPTPLLKRIQKAEVGARVGKIPITPLIKHRAQFALNMRKR